MRDISGGFQLINAFLNKLLNKSSSTNMQIDSLDGLRGIAVLFVLFSHLSRNGMDLVPGLSFNGIGKYGVYLFFVLSAFLLSLPFYGMKSEDLRSSHVWVNYGTRRFFRIYPLMTISLGLSYIMTLVIGNQFRYAISGSEMIEHLLLQQGKGVLWSIPVEFKYYFVLPIVVLVLTLALKLKAWKAILFTSFGIVGSMLLWPSSESQINDISLGPYLPIFLIGSLSALLHRKVKNSALFNTRQVKIVFEIAAWLIFLAILVTTPSFYGRLSGQDISPDSFHKCFVLYGFLWSSFLLSYLNGYGLVRGFLSNPLLRLIGVVSFSMYLWHPPVIKLVSHIAIHLDSTIRAVVCLFVTFLVSIFSYACFERPFLRLRFIPSKNISIAITSSGLSKGM